MCPVLPDGRAETKGSETQSIHPTRKACMRLLSRFPSPPFPFFRRIPSSIHFHHVLLFLLLFFRLIVHHCMLRKRRGTLLLLLRNGASARLPFLLYSSKQGHTRRRRFYVRPTRGGPFKQILRMYTLVRGETFNNKRFLAIKPSLQSCAAATF